MAKEVDLVILIMRLSQKVGTEKADGVLAWILTANSDYLSIKRAVEDYLKNECD